LKPERWGSLLVQENNQEEKACDKRRIIIIIIIIMVIDVTIQGDRNVIQEEADKILKYKNIQ
jgi:hypothetical protein